MILNDMFVVLWPDNTNPSCPYTMYNIEINYVMICLIGVRICLVLLSIFGIAGMNC